jgi:hypothetical protein
VEHQVRQEQQELAEHLDLQERLVLAVLQVRQGQQELVVRLVQVELAVLQEQVVHQELQV